MSSDDHFTTAERVLDAAIVVIGRDGFDTVSVRTVAAEAGLAAGTVQHHFGTRDALLVGAYRRSVERTMARALTNAPQDSFSSALRHAATQAFPHDEQGRAELAVWLSLSAASPTRSGLREAHREAVQQFRDILRDVLERAEQAGQLRAGIDIERETVLIPALLDGLSLQAVSADPGEAVRLAETLDEVLAALFC